MQRDANLIEQVRQIISATPEIRPEKVEPLREAVASGTYEIDARKLANCLITKIIWNPDLPPVQPLSFPVTGFTCLPSNSLSPKSGCRTPN